MSVLEAIQQQQFEDRAAAEQMLLGFIQQTFQLDVVNVTLRPLAVSLNSFNGFITLADGRQLFFKSHVEPGNIITEYYNSDLLHNAGYPIIQPVMASTEPEQQMLLYEVIDDQAVFDAAWELERQPWGEDITQPAATLAAAQQASDDQLFALYMKTLRWQPAEDHAAAPIHQLFHHRLSRGRLEQFYGPHVQITLPTTGTILASTLRQYRWTINGVAYADTLDDIIQRGLQLLAPAQPGPAIVGHGDAHNGNVFLRKQGDTASLLYFDPAFAGIHDPFLDLVKPLYHNVFAMWMYFPVALGTERGASLVVDGDRLVISYPPELHPIRWMFWQSKTDRVLKPVLKALAERNWLRPDWRQYLQAALMCCPLLTMNLAEKARFSPPITLLGFSHVVEMGGQSEQANSFMMRWLDSLEDSLKDSM